MLITGQFYKYTEEHNSKLAASWILVHRVTGESAEISHCSWWAGKSKSEPGLWMTAHVEAPDYEPCPAEDVPAEVQDHLRAVAAEIEKCRPVVHEPS